MDWLKEKIFETNETIDELLKAASTVSPGADGLIFLPYISGERAPLWNSNAKADFIGLRAHHTKAHMIRAAMEAVLFNLLLIGNMLNEQKTISEIHAGGGFAESPFWIQMLADIFNLPVKIYDTIESSALGAIMLGTEIKIEPHIIFLPNKINHAVYAKQFERFSQLALKS